MSTITPTPGRIVWYRGADGEIRPAIVTKGNGPFNADLYVFPREVGDADCGLKLAVTHADPEREPSCLQSWHWMPYQIGQAKKHANEVVIGSAPIAPTSDQALESEIVAKGLTAPRVTFADIEANISSVEMLKHVTASGQVLRWAILIANSGYAVVGKPSVSVSSENDDAEIGTKIALDNSRNEMWPLMGFALKQKLHDAQ